ncbi:MAG TPA: DUF302 domain-containing protein [Nevskiaceae bacterium]
MPPFTPSTPSSGIVSLTSPYSLHDTVERLQAALKAHGATVFAVIDHQAAAERVGLKMPPATLLIFGNPKVGTPLMVENIRVALDLPSKVLVSAATPGTVLVSFNATAWLLQRHALPARMAERLAPLEKLVRDAIQ